MTAEHLEFPQSKKEFPVLNWEQLPIVSLTPFSLQDYPGHTAAILWFTGCNMRCSYCHNPEMAIGRGHRLPGVGIERFLKSRAGFLDGIVFSGGECTLAPGLFDLIRFCKEHEFLMKLDTNGSRPAALEELINEGLLDYVALDFKAPLSKYRQITHWGRVDAWKKSFDLLKSSAINFELRCTVHPDLVDEGDVQEMLESLKDWDYTGPFYIQHFIQGKTLGAIADPSRRFDPQRLEVPETVDLRFRNFETYEAKIKRKKG